MTPEAVLERAAHIADVRSDTAAAKPAIACALVKAGEIKAWIAAQEAGLIGQLSAVDSFPEATIAEASKESLNAASRSKERADTLADTPALAAALEDGSITSGHIDAVTRGSKSVNPEQRDELLGLIDDLAGVATAASVDEFDKRIKLTVKILQADDGEDRLTCQKRAARLSMWTDHEGMWNLRGRFDPLTGLKLHSCIESTTNALFAEKVPAHCPADPIEKQKFLSAHTLERLIHGRAPAGNTGRPAFVAAIDADALNHNDANRDDPRRDGPTVQWSIPIELPARVIAELTRAADITPVVVRNGVVLYAPGVVDLGRTTRLASRAQRRALRGLYRTCAIPGCKVGYDRCKLHHIIWWRHGGRTDLANLLPVCTSHHSNIHHDDWIVELGPNRELTLTLPDGTVRNTGPPTIRAS